MNKDGLFLQIWKYWVTTLSRQKIIPQAGGGRRSKCWLDSEPLTVWSLNLTVEPDQAVIGAELNTSGYNV